MKKKGGETEKTEEAVSEKRPQRRRPSLWMNTHTHTHTNREDMRRLRRLKAKASKWVSGYRGAGTKELVGALPTGEITGFLLSTAIRDLCG